MKIGIDARFYGPESKGLGRYTEQLLTHLEKRDHKNEYVVFLMKKNYDLYTPRQKNFKKVCANYRWYSWQEQVLFLRVLYKQRCDFIHFPHFNVPIFYWRPFIVTVHDLILLRFPTRRGSTRSTWMYWYKFLMYRFVIRRALFASQHIITVSHFTKKDIVRQYRINPEKITVTYEAGPEHPQQTSTPTPLSIQKKYNIASHYMLYVGNAYPHKNLETLIDAFFLWQKQTSIPLKQTQLILVGRDDYFYRRLQREIRQRGIRHVRILYTLDDHDLRALYQGAMLFLFPSLYEGFGLPPLEACAYGTVVLSSRAACMREILGDAVAYTDVSRADVFARDIEDLLNDAQRCATLKAKGYARAQMFTWDRTAQQTFEIYKKVRAML